ncbi:hypothetical protein PAXRUDRAFT_773355 [Paxillus rubicundulus Ve08.2h10]|uniref:Uncharacterized protein n=1 Tax=Paxillus rubicundulus Ve08.2h10 TaxID=930991 RepID=A0A0D0DEY6_9AGAM|nr:hypothetical protein PAXRUDRAFT_773355 [Paxillus rubicundulus Ve08.2h10]
MLLQAFTIIYWIYIVTAFPFDSSLLHKRDVNPALVPPFGWVAGVNPDGTGNCDGAVNGTNGKPIQVPCQCPPNSTFFLDALNKNVAAGFVTTNPTVKLTFPTDNSTASQLARLNAAAVTLQNLEGPGVGCPISSTMFTAQHKAIEAETTNVTSAAPPGANATALSGPLPSTVPSPAPVDTTVTTPPSGNATSPTDDQIAALAPPLGWQSGINPDGTGNCDGAVNGTNGKPILIPCQCPPDQAHYISNLTVNIRAGHVMLNPTVLLTFPTDNSTASQNARLNAAAVTIQNLNGPGKGCPIVSTTFGAQQKAINARELD